MLQQWNFLNFLLVLMQNLLMFYFLSSRLIKQNF